MGSLNHLITVAGIIVACGAGIFLAGLAGVIYYIRSGQEVGE